MATAAVGPTPQEMARYFQNLSNFGNLPMEFASLPLATHQPNQPNWTTQANGTAANAPPNTPEAPTWTNDEYPPTSCRKCPNTCAFNRATSVKEGPNQGRVYYTCAVCTKWNKWGDTNPEASNAQKEFTGTQGQQREWKKGRDTTVFATSTNPPFPSAQSNKSAFQTQYLRPTPAVAAPQVAAPVTTVTTTARPLMEEAVTVEATFPMIVHNLVEIHKKLNYICDYIHHQEMGKENVPPQQNGTHDEDDMVIKRVKKD